MRVLFSGTPELGVTPLVRIASRHQIVGVLCSPDRAKGRGRKVAAPPVKSKTLELGLAVYQPQALDAEFRAAIARQNPEILAVVAYHKIFRQVFLDLFPRGGINLHPSLLPKYRGPSPIQAAILNGDEKLGVTVQRMAREMDAGDILRQTTIPLKGTETTEELIRPVSEIGADLMLAALQDIEEGKEEARPQNHDEATYCKLIAKEDGEIDWTDAAANIARKVRAYTPWPRAYTHYRGSVLAILKAAALSSLARSSQSETPVPSGKPGCILGNDGKYGILIETGDGILAVTELQLQAKRAMDWKAFLHGHREFIGQQLGGHA